MNISSLWLVYWPYWLPKLDALNGITLLASKIAKFARPRLPNAMFLLSTSPLATVCNASTATWHTPRFYLRMGFEQLDKEEEGPGLPWENGKKYPRGELCIIWRHILSSISQHCFFWESFNAGMQESSETSRFLCILSYFDDQCSRETGNFWGDAVGWCAMWMRYGPLVGAEYRDV